MRKSCRPRGRGKSRQPGDRGIPKVAPCIQNPFANVTATSSLVSREIGRVPHGVEPLDRWRTPSKMVSMGTGWHTMLLSVSFSREPRLKHPFLVQHTSTIPECRPEHPHGSFDTAELFLSASRATQQARNRVQVSSASLLYHSELTSRAIRSVSPEVLLHPLIVSRNESERVLIESSINSIRLSIAIKQADEIEKILCHKFTRFMMMRAEGFVILRRKALPVSPPGEHGCETEGLTVEAVGLRHLILDHQLPLRVHAEAQAGRLYHPIHGGCRQGDLGDEAVTECSSPNRRRELPVYGERSAMSACNGADMPCSLYRLYKEECKLWVSRVNCGIQR